MRKLLLSAEQLITVICLIIYSGTPLDPFLTEGYTLQEGDRTIFRLLYTLTYGIAFLLIILRWKKVIYVISKNKLLWALLGFCAISSFWSLDPDTTTRRVFGLIGTTFFGVYLASRYTLKEQLKLCAYMLAISAIACFLVVFLIPQYGLGGDEQASAWRGIYSQKNILGRRFVLSGAIFFFLAMTTRQNRWVLWLGYVASAILVLFSSSTTSLGNLLILTGTFPVYQRVLRFRYTTLIPTLTFIATISIAFYALFVTYADQILGSIGKDTTLTGRSEIWPAVLEMIQKKPLLGYGYGAFWFGADTSGAAYVQESAGWPVPSAHNGFLDLCLALGIVGFLIFIAGFLSSLFKGIYLIRLNKMVENNVWLLIYLTFLAVSNFTETILIEQNSIEWTLYVSAILSSQLSHNFKESYKNTFTANTGQLKI
ncbi:MULTISPECIES: O-antigen ligase [Nostoc]|uniref:O-antigen ligase family protein n=1 Tax=Nostoc paludosum FACHB-159 TaxID=2692908 RepID=A0ABR8K448_9NOSO|nr:MULTISPECIES: O-antigen ligase [Nostoc]MBD2677969.1 O-antigen ligase family protein [Nostoc sp. FACHB-857]MBD2733855.1 O-antigen ligase family protein [Nostoc paludosum FACHB-159]